MVSKSGVYFLGINSFTLDRTNSSRLSSEGKYNLCDSTVVLPFVITGATHLWEVFRGKGAGHAAVFPVEGKVDGWIHRYPGDSTRGWGLGHVAVGLL